MPSNWNWPLPPCRCGTAWCPPCRRTPPRCRTRRRRRRRATRRTPTWRLGASPRRPQSCHHHLLLHSGPISTRPQPPRPPTMTDPLMRWETEQEQILWRLKPILLQVPHTHGGKTPTPSLRYGFLGTHAPYGSHVNGGPTYGGPPSGGPSYGGYPVPGVHYPGPSVYYPERPNNA